MQEEAANPEQKETTPTATPPHWTRTPQHSPSQLDLALSPRTRGVAVQLQLQGLDSLPDSPVGERRSHAVSLGSLGDLDSASFEGLDQDLEGGRPPDPGMVLQGHIVVLGSIHGSRSFLSPLREKQSRSEDIRALKPIVIVSPESDEDEIRAVLGPFRSVFHMQGSQWTLLSCVAHISPLQPAW